MVSTFREAVDRAIAAAEAAEQGDWTPAEISFGTVGKLRQLLTDRRVEIVRSLMDEPAESISALAEQLNRSYSVVHDDADYGIVQFRSDSRDRAPFVPYDSVEIDVTIQGARSTDVEVSG